MTLHSYYPLGVDIPNYAANELSTLTLLAIFASACAILLGATTLITTKANPHISRAEFLTVFWFVLCSAIHFVLEGHYARNFTTLPASQHILSQLWKEYSLSDSRYLTSDAFVLCMEAVTAFCWGPLSLLLAGFIVADHPLRHPIQIVISLGQLYGNVLYYGICAFGFVVNGIEYSRPEKYYFYGYFVFLNAFWIVIPLVLVFSSARACAGAFEVANKVKAGVNGVKKTA
ncbi:Emopamil-binding protein [Aspergillus aurantiobrunneus]